MNTPSHAWLLLNGAAACHARVVQCESKLKAISEAGRASISSTHGSEGSITMRGNDVSRRSLLMSSALGAGAAVGGVPAAAAAEQADVMAPVPMPAQVAAKEAMAEIPGTRIWYWDTGGDGAPVVLMHPASGSALIWGYQQPVLAKAGYRVIAYSRRGYFGSAPYEKQNPGVGSEDLYNLISSLGIAKFHIVASAAGGSVASDYAFSHQDRLLSLTISSNSFGVRDGTIGRAAEAIRPKSFDELPVEFRELGPSYRAANPEGTKHWLELEHKALVGTEYRQKLANEIKQARLKELKLPVLVTAGAADVATPPSIARMIAAEIPGSELAIGPEAGHSVYWEQPDMFNRAVLDFMGKHGK
jgi:pimeloyl-ACP methyl ester carboxylesterase